MLEAAAAHLDRVAELFGGFAAVESLLPLDQLTYITGFPGQVFVVAPWSEVIDLQEIGYIPGSVYQVLNREQRWLYSGSSEGLFNNPRDEQLLTEAYHGEFFHLLVETDKGKRIALLWIAKQISSAQKNLILERLKEQVTHSALPETEIILDTTALIGFCQSIQVFWSRGTWESQNSVPRSKESQITEVIAGESICLFPEDNQWFVFYVEELGIFLSVDLENELFAKDWKQSNNQYHFKRSSRKRVNESLVEPLMSAVSLKSEFRQITGRLVLPQSDPVVE
ncbi:hypothetical protein ACQ4M3_19120 [Leptolyngbya sp. AN03gr2]|uniref:hypothetical protein n=1 Tax=Leptolyngbya sp. AN03gr2 TaxID=3423364 RepID=UPI003D30FB28